MIYGERVREFDFDLEAQGFEDMHFCSEERVLVVLCGLCE